jgi:uncharacterized protein (DUF885 family)
MTSTDRMRSRARLKSLFADFFDFQMGSRPLRATVAQHPGYDDRLEDNSPSGRRQEKGEFQKLLKRLNEFQPESLTLQEKLSCHVMRWQARMVLEREGARLHQWGGFFGVGVDHMEGPQAKIPSVVELAQPLETEADAKALLRRMDAIPDYFSNHVASLKEGLRAGRTATLQPVLKTIGQLEAMLASPVDQTPFVRALTRMPEKLRARYKGKVLTAVEKRAFAGYKVYLNFLLKDYRARCRPDDKAGVCHLPDGKKVYEHLIRFHTTLDFTPDQIHATGFEELRAIQEELKAVGRRMGHRGSVSELMESVRSDKRNFFHSREEIKTCAEDLVKRTTALLPNYFGRLPRTPVIVVPIDEYKEKNDVGARYLEPPQDLSRPGIYFINTGACETRQRFSMPSLTAHEGVPGHHLQFALAAENRELPVFRRVADSYSGATSFSEGWALYAERLADEMGLYRDDLSRLGMLSDQAFRACRLVVDTGLHAMGWTRRQAVDFMLKHTPLTEQQIFPEVDRYAVLPGQALAYKIGQRAVSQIRSDAEKSLGAAFNLKSFHDALLENGALPMPLLRQTVADRLAKRP